MSSLEPTPTQEAPSPRLVAGPSYNNYNSSAPLSPLHVPTHQQQQYANYDYGNYHSPLAQSSTNQWPVESNDPNAGMDMYSSNAYTGVSYGGETFDSHYINYGGNADMNSTVSGLSTTPPTASFDASGLPFQGLDFMRGLNSGGTYATSSEQDSLWHTFDATAFSGDPELPFVVPESLDGYDHDGQLQHHHQ